MLRRLRNRYFLHPRPIHASRWRTCRGRLAWCRTSSWRSYAPTTTSRSSRISSYRRSSVRPRPGPDCLRRARFSLRPVPERCCRARANAHSRPLAVRRPSQASAFPSPARKSSKRQTVARQATPPAMQHHPLPPAPETSQAQSQTGLWTLLPPGHKAGYFRSKDGVTKHEFVTTNADRNPSGGSTHSRDNILTLILPSIGVRHGVLWLRCCSICLFLL